MACKSLVKLVTDDFVRSMTKSGVDRGGFCRMIHICGLPECVDPNDPRVVEIVSAIEKLFGESDLAGS